MEFAQWLQSEMDRNEITKYRLSKMSGVHQTTIANLLNGAKPQIETERKIREAVSAMLGERREKPAPAEETDRETVERLLTAMGQEDRDYIKAFIRGLEAQGKK